MLFASNYLLIENKIGRELSSRKNDGSMDNYPSLCTS